MRENGKMIYNTEKVLKHGQMVQNMMVITHLGESTESVPTSGMMAHSI
jgi:hypothetical protein